MAMILSSAPRVLLHRLPDAKGSGISARSRRLLELCEEKRKREHDRLHNYLARATENGWLLEDACKNDAELCAVLRDSIGNPEEMRYKADRVRRKGRDFQYFQTGSILAVKVGFRDFNPLDSYIWFELTGSPSIEMLILLAVPLTLQIGSWRIHPWSTFLSMMQSSFHNISDVEFQDNWSRVWVDFGTSDYFAIDVLLRCSTVLSSKYLAIQQVVFGGRRMGDREEGMTVARVWVQVIQNLTSLESGCI